MSTTANKAGAKQTTPEVVWAQRSSKHDAERNYVLLTIAAPDVHSKNLKIDLTPTSLTFHGHSETKETDYHVELVFFEEIDPENSQTHHTSRDVIFKLRKKELKEEYWPRLLKDSKRMHFLKTDFDKWVDEDEQDAAPDDDLPGMGGMGGMDGGMGGGMPGMEGMGDGGFGGIDFSKLGGGPGGPGGMPDLGDLGGDEEDEDEDNDMPDLEDEEGAKGEEVEGGKGKGKAEEAEPAAAKKIEEVS